MIIISYFQRLFLCDGLTVFNRNAHISQTISELHQNIEAVERERRGKWREPMVEEDVISGSRAKYELLNKSKVHKLPL